LEYYELKLLEVI